MSEIEELLKKHTDDVGTALGKFAGQIETVEQAVKALTDASKNADMKANREKLFGASRGQDGADVERLSVPDDERKAIGAIMMGRLDSPEFKQMEIRSEPDGGLLVPEQTSTQIEMLIRRQSPVRRVAKVVNLTTGNVLFPLSRGAFEAGWVGENAERSETDTATIAAMSPSGGTCYALPVATEEVIADAIVNLEQFITENVIDVIAEKESQAFINGDGTDKPAGFIKTSGSFQPTSDSDSARALGKLQYVATGQAAALGTLMDVLVSMVFATKAGYRQAPGCAWLASTDMIAAIAKVKDGNGNPIFLPSMMEGVPSMLLGYPVIECEHMDGVAANTFPIAFGNWQRGYLIGDRSSISILRDPYTTKGKIKWYFRKRVYGEVLNSEAIKLMKIAVS